MKHLAQYLRLEYRKTWTVLRSMLLSALLMLILSAGVITAAAGLLFGVSVSDPITVALVFPGEQSEFRMMARAIGLSDSVKEVCRFTYPDEEEAKEGLEDGSIHAAIYLGEDFYNDVNTGVNTPIRVVLPEDSILNTGMFRELLDTAISMVDTTEAAIYAADELAWRNGSVSSVQEIENLLSEIYMTALLERYKLFHYETLSPVGELTAVQYYAAVLPVVLLLFAGLNFGFLYERRERTLEQKLRVFGIGPAETGAVKYLVMCSVLYLAVLLLCLLMYLPAKYGFIPDYEPGPLRLLLLLFPVLSIASVFHLVYAVGGDSSGAGGLMLFALVFLALAGGLVIPDAFLPEALRSISAAVPTGMFRISFTELLFGEPGNAMLLREFVFAAVLFAAGEAVLWKKA